MAQVALARTKDLDALHEKVAKRWFDVCCTNAGEFLPHPIPPNGIQEYVSRVRVGRPLPRKPVPRPQARTRRSWLHPSVLHLVRMCCKALAHHPNPARIVARAGRGGR